MRGSCLAWIFSWTGFITSSALACMSSEALHSLNKPCVIISEWYKGGIRRFNLWYWHIVYKRCTIHFFQYWLDSPEFGYGLMLIMIPQLFFSWILLLSSLLLVFVGCIVCKVTHGCSNSCTKMHYIYLNCRLSRLHIQRGVVQNKSRRIKSPWNLFFAKFAMFNTAYEQLLASWPPWWRRQITVNYWILL